MSQLSLILFLTLSVWSSPLVADQVTFAGSEDLREFDKLIQNQRREPPRDRPSRPRDQQRGAPAGALRLAPGSDSRRGGEAHSEPMLQRPLRDSGGRDEERNRSKDRGRNGDRPRPERGGDAPPKSDRDDRSDRGEGKSGKGSEKRERGSELIRP